MYFITNIVLNLYIVNIINITIGFLKMSIVG